MCNTLNKADYYYGAFLSKILEDGNRPALVVKDSNRGVYKVSTNNGDYHIYIKYASNKKNDKLWNYNYSKDNLKEIEDYIKDDIKLIFGFVCSYENLINTEIGICDIDDFKTCTSFNCEKNEYQRISILKTSNSPYLKFYGTSLDRGKSIEIKRDRINNL